MGVDHGRRHIPVAQELMDGPNIITVLQEMGRKRMPKTVGACRLGYRGLQHGLSYRFLQHGFMKMVLLPQPGLAIDIQT